MVFDPQKFLDVAKELMRSDEKYLRTSIGRAYYSVFIPARDRASELRPDIVQSYTKEDVHGKVRLAFKELDNVYPDAHCRAISGKLRELSKVRGRADYNMNIVIKNRDASKSVTMAEDLIELIENV